MKVALSHKILGAFLSCCLLLLVVGVISFRNSQEFLQSNEMVNHTHEVMIEIEKILLNSVDAETGVRGYILANNEQYLEPFISAKSNLWEHLVKGRTLVSDNPEQKITLDKLEEQTGALINHLEECIQLRRVDYEQSRALLTSGESKRLLDDIRALSGKATAVEQHLLNDRKEKSEQEARTFNLIFSSLLFLILAVLMIAYMIIMQNLRALKKAQSETAAKNWSLTRSTELIKEMQGNQDSNQLAQIIISRLAQYLDASLGVLYLVEGERASLRVAGSYALVIKQRSLEWGEGIVGQAAENKKIIVEHDIHPQYFIFHSTLGQIRPASILAFPFMFEDRVISVIELGTLNRFSEDKLAFLDVVADSVAIAMMSSQARAEIKDLLEETQRQSEELEVQQEELRQTNDTLLQKTDLLEKSEIELKMQQGELQQANIELEEKATLLEEQKKELEDAKQEIEKKANDVETSSRYKSEFLANMSHELRTPLNSILILAQLLSENKGNRLSEKDITYAKNIHSSGTGLLELINEILDLSKIEAGKMELEIERVPFEELLPPLQMMFESIADQKSISFQTEVHAECAPVIHTDRHKLEQIIRNLLSNAFKFTPERGTIALRVAPSPTQSDHIHISVSDSGIGVPKEKHSAIFKAFQQADGSTKRKYGGTGLGLSISRELALALGGNMLLQSEEGVGSVFTVDLPIEFNLQEHTHEKTLLVKERISPKPTSIEAEDGDALDLPVHESDRVILIIEDDVKFANVLLDFVEERHYKGVIAKDGSMGLSYARHLKPLAILLDMNLPILSGQDVLKRIKNDPALRHIPVQIISAYDGEQQSRTLGAFDFIKKPVSVDQLKKVFERIESFQQKKLKKLLIVEDNEQQNKAIAELIGNGSIHCVSAYRGDEAYQLLEQEPFDCMIVDLGLPDMSGVTFMEKIRGNSALSKIPIVVYTGRDLSKAETQQLQTLADTVVLKTAHSHERLLDEAILFLHQVESKLPKEKQRILRTLHKSDEILIGKKILLVDDDIRNIYSLTQVLEDEGMICFTAENGRVAIETLTNNPGIELVLMDIMMPEMDGYEATQEIRKQDAFKKIPIIALTAKAMKGDKEKCLSVGMSDYVSKPVNISQLLSLLRVWIYQG
jgi:CheY-like chemotaxis protein